MTQSEVRGMKLEWKLALFLLIGMLVVGQIATLRFAFATASDLQRAADEIAAAKAAVDQASKNWKTMSDHWTTMGKMTMNPTEKETFKLEGESAQVQKSAVEAESHALAALEATLKHVGSK